MNEDFLQGSFHPDHFGGDGDAGFAQRTGLALQPLAMTFDVVNAHLLARLVIGHAGARQTFQVIERHDVQCRTRSLGQRSGTRSKAGVISIWCETTSMKRG